MQVELRNDRVVLSAGSDAVPTVAAGGDGVSESKDEACGSMREGDRLTLAVVSRSGGETMIVPEV